MHGLHLTADLHDCSGEPRWLLEAEALGAACLQAVEGCGLRAVGQLFHSFPPSADGAGGVTAALLLAESHLCVHTWPERRGVTLDVYVCNFGADHSAKAESLMASLIGLFEPGRIERHALQRGTTGASVPVGTSA